MISYHMNTVELINAFLRRSITPNPLSNHLSMALDSKLGVIKLSSSQKPTRTLTNGFNNLFKIFI
jgi:hypothetical protein